MKKILLLFILICAFVTSFAAAPTSYPSPFSANKLSIFLHSDGSLAFNKCFEDASSFEPNGLAKVKQNGKYGYRNSEGNFVIQPQFDDADNFASNGLAKVQQNGEWIYINSKGKELQSAAYKKLKNSNSCEEFLKTDAQKRQEEADRQRQAETERKQECDMFYPGKAMQVSFKWNRNGQWKYEETSCSYLKSQLK